MTSPKNIDKRKKPVSRVVALGESTTWGYSVSSKEKCWVNRVVAMLQEFQEKPTELINQGIGSNVITPKCPAYDRSQRPSALERLDNEVIALKPDLLFLSYGLNDSRGGTTTEDFREAYQELIDRTRAEISPLIVMLNTYYIHEVCYHLEGWDRSSYDVTDVYNVVIAQIAKKNDIILVDIYAAEKGADWIIDEDHCHPNDLGHLIIANRVFETIVRNCSFPALTMPSETLISQFADEYGNGPDWPGGKPETS